MIQQTRENKKSINITQTAAFLSASFANATRNLGNKNHRGTELYDLQVEFCWLMHEITAGPPYIAPMYIQQANELIVDIPSTDKSG